jgi:hypothetical protein
MTRELRWRIITLQVVMVIVLAFGAGLSLWGSNFTNDQIKGQLEPQKIFMPKGDALKTTIDEINKDFPDLQPYVADLQKYEGQQVVNGEQAHVFAQSYLGLHLRTLADGKVYSELSSLARAEQDAEKKAELNAQVQTAFRGETLRSMLNQAWAFSIFGNVALYAGFGLAVVGLIVLGALVFELFFASKPVEVPVRTNSYEPSRA